MAQDRDRQAGTRSPGQEHDEPPASGAGARRPLDAAARDRIGRGLRLHYAGVLDLPVPERLRALVDDLAARSEGESL